ncbi:MAG: endolytic transglycosylase MltG [Defluviitaleaceae bacterium]|nr:endolytic transglycosylase MltG [Defluviitaleaceae bacterium]
MWKRVLNVINFLFGSLFNIALAVALIAAAYFVTTRAFEYGQTILVANYDEDREFFEVIIEIPEEATPLEIAGILREHELIRNEWIFYLQSILNGSGSHFRAGRHLLNSDMTESVIMYELQRLQEIPSDEPRVTIVEGLTNRQIADVAATLGYFTAAEFLYEAENGEFAYVFLRDVPERANRLEGFLFPDTYYLPQNPSPRDLIVRMLNRFDDVFTPQKWLDIEELNQRLGTDFGVEEIIIIASIIEREAPVREERPIVAGLIYNRLAAGMNLEMISTVVYATNTRRDLLAPSDFQINSPYNTFNRLGLPIAPISNPGAVSIDAALNPANIDYLFMVARGDEARSNYFTANRDAYLAARELYAD